MLRFFLAVILAASALSAAAAKPATPKPEGPEKVTVDQLEQALSIAQGKSDAEMALVLSGLELTERLSGARLGHVKADLPGEKAQQELVILADQSAFQPPPDDEIVKDPTPDAAATRQMLVQIVNYVNATVRQLPNLIAIREITGFEDRPAEDSLEATGVVSLSYLPLHFVGKSGLAVTYRDRKEVVDESATKALKHEGKIGGLVTSGEFGPILSVVLADAIKGKITWARWEQGASRRLAVFHYAVPDEKSNYHVKFCCIVNGYRANGQPDMQVFDERAGYHGDMTFNPADGSILRITMEAEMPAKGLVPNAGIAVEYSPVEIGGKSYICPAKSVSVLQAHTAMQQGAYSRTNYQGAAKTFLNDVEFGQYRRFGSETKILTGDNNPPASVPEAAASPNSQPAASAPAGSPAKAETTPAPTPAPASETASLPAPVAAAAPAQPPPAEPETSVESANGIPNAPVSAPAPAGGAFVLKMTSRLVDVGVVVVDKKGHPVRDLKPEDFEVFDNGRKQEVKFFSEFVGESAGEGVAATGNASPATAEPDRTFSNRPEDASATGTGTVKPAAATEAGTTILLLDESHISWNDLSNARREMIRFLNTLAQGERVAFTQ